MLETFVRILMASIAGVVFLFYTYYAMKAFTYVRKAKKSDISHDKEILGDLAKKSRFTLCYALVMLTIGVLYLTSISVYALAGILFFIFFIVSLFINRFVTRSDIVKM